ncbi:MAG: TVP38/TMEM64 family protein [Alphaproteobacteria bacterium]|nr:TVP38/TMEM64 family protein [Alphaproteobacteria bacterium]
MQLDNELVGLAGQASNQRAAALFPKEKTLGDEAQNDSTAPESSEKVGFSPAKLIPVAILIAGFSAFFVFDLNQYLSFDALKENREALTQWVANTGIVAWLVYAGIYAVVTAFSVPGGAVMTIAGGFLFGPWLGGALTVFGATLGATAVFLVARYALADLLREKAGNAIRKMEKGFNEDALSYLLSLRLIPAFPFWLVNLVPAFLNVSVGVYIFGTAVGIIPGTLVFSFFGDGIGAVLEAGQDIDLGIIFEPRFLLPIIGLGVLALMPVLYKKIKGRSAS